MALRLLFIIDAMRTLSPKKDTSLAFMQTACARGHAVYACRVEDLYAVNDAPLARTRRVEVQLVPSDHHRWVTDVGVQDLRTFDVVFMRKDPPFNMDYIFATYILDLAVSAHTRVLNSPQGLRSCNEKTYILQFPQLTPPTLVAKDISLIRDFVHEHGEVVLKPLDGRGGEGVLLTHAKDLNMRSMIEVLTERNTRFIMAQRFVPESRQGDKRILLIDGQPQGAFLRVPADDDLRGNMSAGARVQAAPLTDHDLALCATLAPRLHADGHIFVGIDLLGPYLTEINVTSPTGVQELLSLSGIDAATAMIEWVERDHTPRP
jgi:glutathione synthase